MALHSACVRRAPGLRAATWPRGGVRPSATSPLRCSVVAAITPTPVVVVAARSAKHEATAAAVPATTGLALLLRLAILARHRKRPTSTVATRALLLLRAVVVLEAVAVLCEELAFRLRRRRLQEQRGSRRGGGWRPPQLRMLGRTPQPVVGARRAPGPAGAAAALKVVMTAVAVTMRITAEGEACCTRASGARAQAAVTVRAVC